MKKLYALLFLLFLVILSFSACTSDLACDSLGCSSGSSGPESTPVYTGPCHADFYADITHLDGPGYVNFYSTSVGNIKTLIWTFGNDRTGIGAHPSTYYKHNGYYTVTLKITGTDCDDVETKVNYIEVAGC
jgi:PKD repeat protein